MTKKRRSLPHQSLEGVLSPGMIALHEAINATATNYYTAHITPEKPQSQPLPYPTIEDVVRAMESVPEVLTITKQRQLSLGATTGNRVDKRALAFGLIRRAHDLGSAAHAVTELLNLAQTNCAKSRLTLVLAGVQVESAVELAPGVTLLPFSDIQPPSWSNELEDRRRWPVSPTLEPVGPSAALVSTVTFRPVLTCLDQVPDRYPELEVDKLRILASCIALAMGGPVARLLLWCEDDDPRLPMQSSGVTFHDWISAGIATPCVADADRIRAVIADYQKFKGSKDLIEMSMARLASAWGSWNRESRAVDLGIALEAILMCDKGIQGGETSTEIKYKLGTRAAWLVGKDFAERELVFGSVRRLYDRRSQAAHKGRVSVKPDNWKAVDAEIEEAIALTGRLIKTLLSLRKWPDWNKLVLGEKQM